MEQLIMHWKNDGVPARPMALPEGVAVRRFPQLAGPTYAWLDIVRFMEQGAPADIAEDAGFYREVMECRPHYNPFLCFFLLVKGVPAATVTVICDPDKREGYVHMVACKPEYRGRGLGHLLASLAVETLKKEGTQTAYLTTDDWRLAAIKTYLAAGFTPDLDSQPDFRERWKAILSVLDGVTQ